jgi:hypothetical protein
LFFSTLATADDYLDSINAEAKRIETITRAEKELERAKVQPTASKPAPKKATPSAPQPHRMEMEDELRLRYPAAFSLYTKMDAKGKQRVLDEYLKADQGGSFSRQAAAIQFIITSSIK